MIPMLLLGTLYAFCQSPAQVRFDYSKPADFTKLPTEHVIVELKHPVELRKIRGVVTDQTGFARSDVTFEIREKSSDSVKSVNTDARGRFQIKHVGEGTYDFKATLDGFKSVVGVIIVSRKADSNESLPIEMTVGD